MSYCHDNPNINKYIETKYTTNEVWEICPTESKNNIFLYKNSISLHRTSNVSLVYAPSYTVRVNISPRFVCVYSVVVWLEPSPHINPFSANGLLGLSDGGRPFATFEA